MLGRIAEQLISHGVGILCIASEMRVKTRRRYEVGTAKDGPVRYYFVREIESLEIETLTAKYLVHKTKGNRSPNTVRRAAYALCFYLEYLNEKQMRPTELYGLSSD